MQDTWVQSLGWEDLLQKGMSTHFNKYFCLVNSMDRGAWWATVYGVAKRWTQPSDYNGIWGPSL